LLIFTVREEGREWRRGSRGRIRRRGRRGGEGHRQRQKERERERKTDKTDRQHRAVTIIIKATTNQRISVQKFDDWHLV
jgi:hypothetical protein